MKGRSSCFSVHHDGFEYKRNAIVVSRRAGGRGDGELLFNGIKFLVVM